MLQLGAIEGKVALSFALLAQLCRALHQAALDSNSWTNAGVLIPTPDPSRLPAFAGPARQMIAVANYSKAFGELTKNRQAPKKGPLDKEKAKK